jgi:hypothetical protein
MMVMSDGRPAATPAPDEAARSGARAMAAQAERGLGLGPHYDPPGRSVIMGTTQTPPDVKILFSRGVDAIRLVSLGPQSRGRYAADREYWLHLSDADLDVDEMTFTGAPLDAGYTEADINAVLGDRAASFSHQRVIPTSGWIQKPRVTPDTRAGYLFSAPDPDDATKRIGVLIEQDKESKAVVATGWYKSWVRPDSLIWGRREPFKFTMTRVKNGATPTTDPRFITGNPDQVWYHTIMGDAS